MIFTCARNGSANSVLHGKGDILNTTGNLTMDDDRIVSPTISSNQGVIPGSPLQLSMSQNVRGPARKRSSLLWNIEDECIFCLDAFHNRPKMYTLCRCGENRLNIHREYLHE
jgi:hypothetical protein